jgi:hypothetical protein
VSTEVPKATLRESFVGKHREHASSESYNEGRFCMETPSAHQEKLKNINNKNNKNNNNNYYYYYYYYY